MPMSLCIEVKLQPNNCNQTSRNSHKLKMQSIQKTNHLLCKGHSKYTSVGGVS